jgi:hypothetical protein
MVEYVVQPFLDELFQDLNKKLESTTVLLKGKDI